jgi:hypothetical protein
VENSKKVSALIWAVAVTVGFFFVLFFKTDLLIQYFELLAVLLLGSWGITAWRMKRRKL